METTTDAKGQRTEYVYEPQTKLLTDIYYVDSSDSQTGHVSFSYERGLLYCTLKQGGGGIVPSHCFVDSLKAMRYVSCGFTLLLDATDSHWRLREGIRFALQLQNMAMDSGVAKIALLLPSCANTQKLYAQIAERLGTHERQQLFHSHTAAERWLNARPEQEVCSRAQYC